MALAAAARLVRLDLLLADENLSGAVRNKRWDRAYVQILMEAWESGRERLAFGITDRMQWDTLAHAIGARSGCISYRKENCDRS